MDYATGRAIRNKGLSGLITQNLLNPEMGIGQSFTTALSNRTKATVTGIKEAFDPLNIAKKLTGGSKLAPALLGRLTGRNKTTIQHFSGRKSASASGVNFETGESLGPSASVQTLGFIFEELIKADEIKKQEQEDYYKNEAKRDKDELDRTVAIITAISGKKIKAKAKKEYARDEKGRFVKQDRTRTTENKPDGMDVPKTRTTPTTPSGTTPTTPKSLPTSPATSVAKEGAKSVVSTAAKVAGAAVLGGTMASAIGASESGGNYDISFGDRFDKKSGKVINVAKDPKTGQPLNLMTPEEFSGGKKLTEMTLEEVKAFGKYRSQNGAGAGAVGKYQFMPSTLFGRTNKQGKHIPGLVDQLGLSMDTKFSGTIQEQLQEFLHTQDVNALKKAGVPITPGYEYMAHYIGAGGAAAVYNSIKRGEDKTVAQVMMDAGYSVGNNAELYKIRAMDFEKELQSRLEKKGNLAPHSSADSGEQIDAKSKENIEMKKSVEADKRNATTVNSTTINSSSTSSPTPGKEKEQEDDRPAYIKKRRG
jgi:hypothetical protein